MQDILALAGTYRNWSAGMQYAAALAADEDAALTGIFVCEPIVPLASIRTLQFGWQEATTLHSGGVTQSYAAVVEAVFPAEFLTVTVTVPEWLGAT